MEEDKTSEDYPPVNEILKVQLKIGEVFVEIPIYITEKETLDYLIKKIKQILKDKTFKEYLKLVEMKKKTGDYIG